LRPQPARVRHQATRVPGRSLHLLPESDLRVLGTDTGAGAQSAGAARSRPHSADAREPRRVCQAPDRRHRLGTGVPLPSRLPALPGFYKPARIKGVDYVDGGVRRTANIDVAIEHGADLVICYNPFRPFSNRVVRRFIPERNAYKLEGRPLADQGMLTVLNQVLRTLLHSRLQLGIRQYQDDPHFQGDIILLEPGSSE